jgi:hypothetical protein
MRVFRAKRIGAQRPVLEERITAATHRPTQQTWAKVTMALQLFSKKFMDFASKTYKKALATELNKMGR